MFGFVLATTFQSCAEALSKKDACIKRDLRNSSLVACSMQGEVELCAFAGPQHFLTHIVSVS